MKRLLIPLLALTLLTAGCLDMIDEFEEFEEDESGEYYGMSSDVLNGMLAEETLLDPAYLAQHDEVFGFSISSSTVEDGESNQISISMQKDEVERISSVAVGVTAGYMTIEYEKVTSDERIGNVRVSNQWFTIRDEQPEFVDPFLEWEDEWDDEEDDCYDDYDNEIECEDEEDEYEESEEDELFENPLDDLPDVTEMFEDDELEWTITYDELSTQHVASASNDEEEYYVELMSNPPIITSIEMYALDGSESVEVKYLYGDAIELAITESYPRTSVELDFDYGFESDYETGIAHWWGELSDENSEQVLLSELELRVGTSGEEDEFVWSADMMLADGSDNFTDDDGFWWNLTWNDVDGDGLATHGDSYAVYTNSTSAWDLEVVIYDHWAEMYEGGPLPAFEVFYLLLGLLFALPRK